MPKNNILYRELRLDGNINEDDRTVDISFSSEAPVERYDWRSDSYYNEILSHESGNVDMTRLENLGVCLYNHNMNQVIGAIIDPQLDDKERRCKARIRFDKDELSETIYQKVKSGTLKGISVGYSIDRKSIEIVPADQKSADGRISGPCRIARLWTPFEVSIVSIPADIDVGIGRSLDSEELADYNRYKEQKKEEIKRQQRLNYFENLKRDLEILEME